MSEDVRYKGKLKLILHSSEETIEEDCKNLLYGSHDNVVGKYLINPHKENSMHEYFELPYLEELRYEIYELYNHIYVREFYENGIKKYDIYEVLNLEEEYATSWFRINENLEFDLSYYNGGFGFEEALDRAFDNIGK